MPAIDLKYAFGLKPEKAIEYFQAKGFRITWDWHEMLEAAHAKAFTVAKVMRTDILQDIHGELQKALDQGLTFADWKKNVTPRLKAKGWWGEVVNEATGEIANVGPHRLRTIFETNIQTSYMVGRYQQMMENSTDRPWWMYVAVMDKRTRPAHSALNGLVFRFDDPFWDSHYPPSGFRCFPAGTPVLTPLGWRSIESIGLHDRVIGGSGDEQFVTAIHINPFDGNLIGIAFEGGIIATTPNHRILTMRGWVRADSLQKGDILVQTAKPAGINTVVGDIDQPQTQGTNCRMSFPVQGESPVALAFYGQIELGDEDVDPFGTDSSMYDMVVDNAHALCGEMVNDNFFCPCRGGQTGGMRSRIPTDDLPTGDGKFRSDLRPSGGSGNPQLLGGASRPIVGLLGLTEPGVSALPDLSEGHILHRGGLSGPSLSSIDPLSLNRLAAFAGGNGEMAEQPHESAVIDTPAGAQLAIGELLLNIETAEDFGGGAPLDSFDTLQSFTAWAWSHAHLREIDFISLIPYTGNVFNLSVEKDRSYIIPGATVHNCRCSVRALTDGRLKEKVAAGEAATRSTVGPNANATLGTVDKPLDREGKKMYPATTVKTTRLNGEKIAMAPDAGWSYNPGKAGWQPDLEKLDHQIARHYIADSLKGPGFERFFAGKVGGDFPIAVLRPEDKAVLGSETQTVWLSQESLKDHLLKHPEIILTDYQRIPSILDDGEVYKRGAERLVYLKMDGVLYRAGIKRTKDKGRNYLLTLFKTSDELADIQVRSKLERIR